MNWSRGAPILDDLRFATYEEGLCVQTLHIGPYATEPATVAKLEAFALDHGYLFHRKHHEIYLSDYRRTVPAKLRTILRYPIEPVKPAG